MYIWNDLYRRKAGFSSLLYLDICVWIFIRWKRGEGEGFESIPRVYDIPW